MTVPVALELSTIKTPRRMHPRVDVPFASFSNFAELLVAVHSAETRAKKCDLIAHFFSSLNVDDLAVSARLFAGYYSQTQLQHDRLSYIECSINSIAACTGVTPNFVRERLVALNNVGDVAFELFSGGQTIAVATPATLQEVAKFLTNVNTLRGVRKRTDCLTAILRRCGPRTACYLVNILASEMAVGIHENLVKEAASQWLNVSLTQIQSINLLTNDIGDTVVRCSTGNADSAGVKVYQPIDFANATNVVTVHELSRLMPSTFIVEDRIDGVRVQVHVGLDVPKCNRSVGVEFNGLRVVVFSRSLQDITSAFPDLIQGLSSLLDDSAGTVEDIGLILDGKIIPLTKDTGTTSSDLTRRVNCSNPSLELMEKVPVGFIAFDQLYGEGRAITHESWSDRRSILCKLAFDNKTTFLANTKTLSNAKDIEAEYAASVMRGSGGLVVKNPQSRYNSTRPISDWLSITHLLPARNESAS